MLSASKTQMYFWNILEQFSCLFEWCSCAVFLINFYCFTARDNVWSVTWPILSNKIRRPVEKNAKCTRRHNLLQMSSHLRRTLKQNMKIWHFLYDRRMLIRLVWLKTWKKTFSTPSMHWWIRFIFLLEDACHWVNLIKVMSFKIVLIPV